MAKRAASSEGSDPLKPADPKSVSFHFDAAFRDYLPKLQENAARRKLDLGPAARELVKEALDRAGQPGPVAGGTVLGADALHDLGQSVKSLDLTVRLALRENREGRELLRQNVAKAIRLAFTVFRDIRTEDLSEADIDFLVTEAFGPQG